jgi:hypothetical protein
LRTLTLMEEPVRSSPLQSFGGLGSALFEIIAEAARPEWVEPCQLPSVDWLRKFGAAPRAIGNGDDATTGVVEDD